MAGPRLENLALRAPPQWGRRIAHAHSAGPWVYGAVWFWGCEIDAKTIQIVSNSKKMMQHLSKTDPGWATHRECKNNFWRVVRRRVASKTLSATPQGSPYSAGLRKIIVWLLLVEICGPKRVDSESYFGYKNCNKSNARNRCRTSWEHDANMNLKWWNNESKMDATLVHVQERWFCPR